jgi:hypothetical protein
MSSIEFADPNVLKNSMFAVLGSPDPSHRYKRNVIYIGGGYLFHSNKLLRDLSSHPSHVASVLSHESLHLALQKIRQVVAAYALDDPHYTGFPYEQHPSGMLAFEVMRRRLRDTTAQRDARYRALARRLTK